MRSLSAMQSQSRTSPAGPKRRIHSQSRACSPKVRSHLSPSRGFTEFRWKDIRCVVHKSAVYPNDTSIAVDNASDLVKLKAPFTIQIDEENILISNVSGNILNVANGGRGYGGTVAGSHSTNVISNL